MKHLKIALILCIFGLLLSFYSLYHHYAVREGISSTWCNIGTNANCDIVALSVYSEILGIPLPFFGIAWFALVLVLVFAKKLQFLDELLAKEEKFYLFLWSLLGMAFVGWFAFAEIALLQTLCIVCTLIHLLVIAIFILSILSLEKPLQQSLKNILSD